MPIELLIRLLVALRPVSQLSPVQILPRDRQRPSERVQEVDHLCIVAARPRPACELVRYSVMSGAHTRREDQNPRHRRNLQSRHANNDAKSPRTHRPKPSHHKSTRRVRSGSPRCPSTPSAALSDRTRSANCFSTRGAKAGECQRFDASTRGTSPSGNSPARQRGGRLVHRPPKGPDSLHRPPKGPDSLEPELAADLVRLLPPSTSRSGRLGSPRRRLCASMLRPTGAGHRPRRIAGGRRFTRRLGLRWSLPANDRRAGAADRPGVRTRHRQRAAPAADSSCRTAAGSASRHSQRSAPWRVWVRPTPSSAAKPIDRPSPTIMMRCSTIFESH